jgi:L-2-hydroxyglutarate oxidase
MGKKILIIGGGILGLAVSFKLSKFKTNKITLLEKEDKLGKHQSGNNSGVLHCGLYYEPDSLKAKLAVDGIRQMISFCQDNKIEHDVCGKIVVASNIREISLLDSLAKRGELNGLKGLKILTKQQLREREPNVKAEKSLLVPEEGIVDYHKVMNKMSVLIKENGGKFYFGSEILKTTEGSDGIIVETNCFKEKFDLIINCTGLQSDLTYKKLTKNKRPLRIIPFRGEYLEIKDEYKNLVNHLIYPVPDPQYPFLGVHFTRMINGGREVGPNAVLALKREGYKNTQISLGDSFDTFTYEGFYKFLYKNFGFAVNEFASSIFKSSFVNKAKKLIPDVEGYMLKDGTAGVRAQAMDKSGNLIMDFKIYKHQNQIHVLNAPSPGATASLSIADYIIENYI